MVRRDKNGAQGGAPAIKHQRLRFLRGPRVQGLEPCVQFVDLCAPMQVLLQVGGGQTPLQRIDLLLKQLA
jgi:hypothetical protein